MAIQYWQAGRDIARGLRAAYWHMHRETQAALSEFGVTAEQFVLLRVLEEEAGLTQQELARRADSDPNTVRAVLMILERKKLVVRKPHPTDRRAKRVTLTPLGAKKYQQMCESLKPLQQSLGTLLSSPESEALVAALSAIVEGLSKRSPQSEASRANSSEGSPLAKRD